MISIKENYEKKVIPHFIKDLGYKNIFAIPRLIKVTVNTGIGSMLKNESNTKELLETVKQDITMITGQKPLETKAKQSVAGFGTRKGQVLGVKVTLRGKRMRDFLERLINLALPRSRDFAGIPLKAVDGSGNLTIGVKEHTIFPEIGTGKQAQKVKKIFGLEITVSTSANNKQEGEALYRMLGFPMERNEDNK